MSIIGIGPGVPSGLASVTTWGQYSACSAVGGATSGWASSAWPSANLAIYVPIRIGEAMIATQMYCGNGATASGNLDVGIYDIQGTRIVSSGSTAQSGTSTLQIFDITDTLIGPGVFYLALAMDGTTGTMYRHGLTAVAVYHRVFGSLQQATAFALPATATFAAYTQTVGVPLVGFTGRAVVP